MSFAGKQNIKGALHALKPNSKDLGELFFVFQYNPEMLTRTIVFLNQDGTLIDNSNRDKTVPTHFINLTLYLDAADQGKDAEKNKISDESGLHPSLAVLESMMYPQAEEGKQVEQPVLLFVWGPKRILPVRIASLKVSEEAFDANLNPIKAKIDLCMRALDRSELKQGSLGYNSLDQRSNLVALYRKQNITSSKKAPIKKSIKDFEKTTKAARKA